MGMMTRRNVKARVAKSTPAVIEKPVVEVVKEEAKEEVRPESLADKIKAKELSKTEINRMSTADLKELAESFGIEGFEEMSGNQIKKMLTGALEE